MGDDVGEALGLAVGPLLLGAAVGDMLGPAVGDTDGFAVGLAVGDDVELALGLALGPVLLGAAVGDALGPAVGTTVRLGGIVGRSDPAVGRLLGCAVGRVALGCAVVQVPHDWRQAALIWQPLNLATKSAGSQLPRCDSADTFRWQRSSCCDSEARRAAHCGEESTHSALLFATDTEHCVALWPCAIASSACSDSIINAVLKIGAKA